MKYYLFHLFSLPIHFIEILYNGRLYFSTTIIL